jgi:chemotaxis protein histidine kinase CheA
MRNNKLTVLLFAASTMILNSCGDENLANEENAQDKSLEQKNNRINNQRTKELVKNHKLLPQPNPSKKLENKKAQKKADELTKRTKAKQAIQKKTGELAKKIKAKQVAQKKADELAKKINAKQVAQKKADELAKLKAKQTAQKKADGLAKLKAKQAAKKEDARKKKMARQLAAHKRKHQAMANKKAAQEKAQANGEFLEIKNGHPSFTTTDVELEETLIQMQNNIEHNKNISEALINEYLLFAKEALDRQENVSAGKKLLRKFDKYYPVIRKKTEDQYKELEFTAKERLKEISSLKRKKYAPENLLILSTRLIRLKAVSTEGIFRKSGNESLANQLLERMAEGKIKTSEWNKGFKSMGIHDIGKAYKQTLRDDPFISFNDISKLEKIGDEIKFTHDLKLAFDKMPKRKQKAFKNYLNLMRIIASNSPANKMTTSNLAIATGPSIISLEKNADLAKTIFHSTQGPKVVERILNFLVHIFFFLMMIFL